MRKLKLGLFITVLCLASPSSAVTLADRLLSVMPAGAPQPPPTVISKSPASGATGVPLNSKIVARFNEAMKASTFTTSTVSLNVFGSPITGTVAVTTTTYANDTVTFTPTSSLIAGDTYTVVLSTGIQNSNGVAMASSVSWNFTALAGCFTAGTLVTMANGEKKPIEEIHVGDKVLSADSGGHLVAGFVTKTVFHKKVPVTMTMIFDTKAGRIVLHATPNHLFFVGSYLNVEMAEDMKPGDIVFYRQGAELTKATLIGVKVIYHDVKVYNFEVDKVHDYFANDILVHNAPS